MFKIKSQNYKWKVGLPVHCHFPLALLFIHCCSVIDVAKRVATAELLIHKRRSKNFFLKIKHITETTQKQDDVAAISIDYMQNLQLPVVPVQETFYLRQLTVSLFNIHDLKSNEARFYIYHEGIARKSPNEVCSFLFDYIKNAVNQTVRHLHIFSDGYGGQNTNHTVFRFLLMLIATGRFDTNKHYFPCRGHSYLPSDREFSVVKRKLRKTDRVFLLKEYVELIVQSNTNNRFEVNVV